MKKIIITILSMLTVSSLLLSACQTSTAADLTAIPAAESPGCRNLSGRDRPKCGRRTRHGGVVDPPWSRPTRLRADATGRGQDCR